MKAGEDEGPHHADEGAQVRHGGHSAPHRSVVALGPKSGLAASYSVEETEIPGRGSTDCRSGSRSRHNPGPQPVICLGDLQKLPQPAPSIFHPVAKGEPVPARPL